MRMRSLPRLDTMPPEEELTEQQSWEHCRYFLAAVVPAADAAGVRLACHPNDPPPPTSRSAAQVLCNLEGMR